MGNIRFKTRNLYDFNKSSTEYKKNLSAIFSISKYQNTYVTTNKTCRYTLSKKRQYFPSFALTKRVSGIKTILNFWALKSFFNFRHSIYVIQFSSVQLWNFLDIYEMKSRLHTVSNSCIYNLILLSVLRRTEK